MERLIPCSKDKGYLVFKIENKRIILAKNQNNNNGSRKRHVQRLQNKTDIKYSTMNPAIHYMMLSG